MSYDICIIGSSLSAMGFLHGLSENNFCRGKKIVLILDDRNQVIDYPAHPQVPLEFNAAGGLSNLWHSIIPCSSPKLGFSGYNFDSYSTFLRHYYPFLGDEFSTNSFFHYSTLFVPFFRLRALPRIFSFSEIISTNGNKIDVVSTHVSKICRSNGFFESFLADGSSVLSRKIVLGVGSLSVIPLLSSFFGIAKLDGQASDHIILYHGVIDAYRQGYQPIRSRNFSGYIFQAPYSADLNSIYYSRPALFDFSQLDYPILHRSSLGFKRSFFSCSSYSLGLLAEQLNNRFSLAFPSTHRSIYSQTLAVDSYSWSYAQGSFSINYNKSVINSAISNARDQLPWRFFSDSKWTSSQQFIPGVHLHNSVSGTALADALASSDGITCLGSSVVSCIGAEHHGFRAAYISYQAGLSFSFHE